MRACAVARSCHNGVSLDLNQHAGVDQAGYLDAYARGQRLREVFLMNPADLFPGANVGDEEPGPDHVVQRRARIYQGLAYPFEHLPGLCGYVGTAHWAVRAHGGSTRYADEIPDTHGP